MVVLILSLLLLELLVVACSVPHVGISQILLLSSKMHHSPISTHPIPLQVSKGNATIAPDMSNQTLQTKVDNLQCCVRCTVQEMEAKEGVQHSLSCIMSIKRGNKERFFQIRESTDLPVVATQTARLRTLDAIIVLLLLLQQHQSEQHPMQQPLNKCLK